MVIAVGRNHPLTAGRWGQNAFISVAVALIASSAAAAAAHLCIRLIRRCWQGLAELAPRMGKTTAIPVRTHALPGEGFAELSALQVRPRLQLLLAVREGASPATVAGPPQIVLAQHGAAEELGARLQLVLAVHEGASPAAVAAPP
eukprot:CAMPEP_0179072274 /NCGR_PEP_ID=MMETSP0796-20121207/31969_1 /TAXON_ID=73915 /ORGANISM="Pyrodinium bahamense, Strain pbaha01" /LENGTH=144 /DNA_ID=CAMNT_0020769427 /DNA_START=289 /DNA_END=723 /DNA_ORIENTATION=+